MKPRFMKNVKLLLFLCFNIFVVHNAFGDGAVPISMINRTTFETILSTYTDIDNIDFEGIATGVGEDGIYGLSGNEFASQGITISNSIGSATVGIPDETFWTNFLPTSDEACLAADSSEKPNGVIVVTFESPVYGVGADFLNAIPNLSKIAIFGQGFTYAQVPIPGGAGQQQFIGIIDPDGRIEEAHFYIGYKPNILYPQYPTINPDGAAIDDLTFDQIGNSVLQVGIDIKPGSYPNAINLGSNGVVPVAILSSESFDATQVDPETVTLAGSGVAVRGKGSKYLAHIDDVNNDGLLDLVCQVETENLDPDTFQEGHAILAGSTYDSQGIVGSDEIMIVPPE